VFGDEIERRIWPVEKHAHLKLSRFERVSDIPNRLRSFRKRNEGQTPNELHSVSENSVVFVPYKLLDVKLREERDDPAGIKDL
jgi:phosphoglycerate-specific signal transduction histidine kinase